MSSINHSRPAHRTRGRTIENHRGDDGVPAEFRSKPRRPSKPKDALRAEADAAMAAFLRRGGKVHREDGR